MNIRGFLTVSSFIALLTINTSVTHAQFGDLLKRTQKALSGSKLSENEITQGLKEALQIGTVNAVQMGSKIDGYYKNPHIKIPLPEEVQKMGKILEVAGLSQHVDAFELSMNRAAEQAAPEAKSLFWEAIKQMNFSDAQKILEGQDNAATLYFKDKTSKRLHDIFKPIVHQTMSKVGTTRTYQDLAAKIQSIPFAGSLNFDLDQYVTDNALDGLFFLLSEEEIKIRQDPTARVTDLLKEVFGSN